jgi:hypothetical protein
MASPSVVASVIDTKGFTEYARRSVARIDAEFPGCEIGCNALTAWRWVLTLRFPNGEIWIRVHSAALNRLADKAREARRRWAAAGLPDPEFRFADSEPRLSRSGG